MQAPEAGAPGTAAASNSSAVKHRKQPAKKGPKRGARNQAGGQQETTSQAPSNHPEVTDLAAIQHEVNSSTNARERINSTTEDGKNTFVVPPSQSKGPGAGPGPGAKKRTSANGNNENSQPKSKVNSQQEERPGSRQTPQKQRERERKPKDELMDFAEPGDNSGDFIEPTEP
jgi:hypothetical protein